VRNYFTDSRRRRQRAREPAALAGIVRCRSVKRLGVVIADDYSVTQHVQRLVTSSERTDKLRAVSVALPVPRTEQCGFAASLARYRRRSSDVHRQRMARFHQGV